MTSMVDKLAKIESMVERYKMAYKWCISVHKSGGKVRFEFEDGTKYVVDYHGEYISVEEDLFGSDPVWSKSFAEVSN